MTGLIARQRLVSPHPGIAFAGLFSAFVAVAAALAAALLQGRLFAALPWAAATFDGSSLHAVWNALALLWISTLVVMRSQTPPRFDASLVPPVALLMAVLQWPCPWLLGLVLVFGHPLVAIAVLDRELRRLHRHWLPTWQVARLAVPLGACVVWLLTGLDGEIAARSPVEQSIVRHAGAELLPFAPARSLVAPARLPRTGSLRRLDRDPAVAGPAVAPVADREPAARAPCASLETCGGGRAGVWRAGGRGALGLLLDRLRHDPARLLHARRVSRAGGNPLLPPLAADALMRHASRDRNVPHCHRPGRRPMARLRENWRSW